MDSWIGEGSYVRTALVGVLIAGVLYFIKTKLWPSKKKKLRDENSEVKEYKIALLGAAAVGKTCIIYQLMSGSFVEHHNPTLEDTYRKSLRVDGTEALLFLYDTPSKTEYYLERNKYIRKAEGYILTYSITDRASFEEIPQLQQNITSLTGKEAQKVVLVGNKLDEEDKRKVQKQEGQDLANKYGWGFLETSAKKKINVVEAFEQIVREMNKN